MATIRPLNPTPIGQPTSAATDAGELQPRRSMVGAPLPGAERNQFQRGLSAGTDSLQGSGYGFLALLGSGLNLPQLRDYGLENYERNEQEAGAANLRVSKLEEIDDFGDLLDWAGGALGQAVPSLAAAVAGGGVGGLLGREVAKRAVVSMVAQGIERSVAQRGITGVMADTAQRRLMMKAVRAGVKANAGTTGLKVGAGMGAFAASAVPQQGALYMELKAAGVEDGQAQRLAWGVGAVQGGLDLIPQIMAAKKIFGPAVKDQLEKSLLRGVLGAAAKPKSFGRAVAGTIAAQTAAEGVTEGSQELLSVLARMRGDPTYKFDDEAGSRILNAAAAGALVGATIGGGTGSFAQLRANFANKKKTDAAKARPVTAKPGQPGVTPATPGAAPAGDPAAGPGAAPVTDPQAGPVGQPGQPGPSGPVAAAPTQSPSPAGPQAGPAAQAGPAVDPVEAAPPTRDTPSAEPELDLMAQVRDLADETNPRKAVFLSAANLEANPALLKGEELKGFAKIPNADGRGGTLVMKLRDAQEFREAVAAGEPRDAVIGRLTRSGDGKPETDNPVVVQQKDAQGAVTAESVVDGNDEAAIQAAAAEYEQDGRDVEVTSPQEVLARREAATRSVKAVQDINKIKAEIAARAGPAGPAAAAPVAPTIEPAPAASTAQAELTPAERNEAELVAEFNANPGPSFTPSTAPAATTEGLNAAPVATTDESTAAPAPTSAESAVAEPATEQPTDFRAMDPAQFAAWLDSKPELLDLEFDSQQDRDARAGFYAWLDKAKYPLQQAYDAYEAKQRPDVSVDIRGWDEGDGFSDVMYDEVDDLIDDLMGVVDAQEAARDADLAARDVARKATGKASTGIASTQVDDSKLRALTEEQRDAVLMRLQARREASTIEESEVFSAGMSEGTERAAQQIIGKNGTLHASKRILSKGERTTKDTTYSAAGWISTDGMRKAKGMAANLSQVDPDSDYRAVYYTTEQAQARGLDVGESTTGGHFVIMVPKEGAETQFSKAYGAVLTYAGMVRAGITHGLRRWNILGKKLKENAKTPHAPQYGLQFLDPENQLRTLASREITKLGRALDPAIANVRSGTERAILSFFQGLAAISGREGGDLAFKPAHPQMIKWLSMNTVIAESNGKVLTLGDALSKAAVSEGEAEVGKLRAAMDGWNQRLAVLQLEEAKLKELIEKKQRAKVPQGQLQDKLTAKINAITAHFKLREPIAQALDTANFERARDRFAAAMATGAPSAVRQRATIERDIKARKLANRAEAIIKVIERKMAELKALGTTAGVGYFDGSKYGSLRRRRARLVSKLEVYTKHLGKVGYDMTEASNALQRAAAEEVAAMTGEEIYNPPEEIENALEHSDGDMVLSNTESEEQQAQRSSSGTEMMGGPFDKRLNNSALGTFAPVDPRASNGKAWTYARRDPNGYELSTEGDGRFSALTAKLKDGRTIEEAYQLDVKGYRAKGNYWKLGKGKPSLRDVNLWDEYLGLWRQWANENPALIEDLRKKAKGKVLTDKFSNTPISQARALAQILEETEGRGRDLTTLTMADPQYTKSVRDRMLNEAAPAPIVAPANPTLKDVYRPARSATAADASFGQTEVAPRRDRQTSPAEVARLRGQLNAPTSYEGGAIPGQVLEKRRLELNPVPPGSSATTERTVNAIEFEALPATPTVDPAPPTLPEGTTDTSDARVVLRQRVSVGRKTSLNAPTGPVVATLQELDKHDNAAYDRISAIDDANFANREYPLSAALKFLRESINWFPSLPYAGMSVRDYVQYAQDWDSLSPAQKAATFKEVDELMANRGVADTQNLGNEPKNARSPANRRLPTQAVPTGPIPQYGAQEVQEDSEGFTVEESNDVDVNFNNPLQSVRFAGMVTELRSLLGLKSRIIVTDSVVSMAEAANNNGDFDFTEHMASTYARERVPFGKHWNNGNGVTYIWINPDLLKGATSFGRAVKTMSHELGHAFFQQTWHSADPKLKAAVRAGFERFKAANPERVRKLNSKGQPMHPEGQLEEWFADQVAAWVATARTPRNLVEQFFKDIADLMQKAWDAIRKVHVLDESMSDYIHASIVSQDRAVHPSLTSLGVANDVMFDMENPPVEDSTVNKLTTAFRAWKMRSPNAGAALDNLGGAALALHNSLLSAVHARMRRMGYASFNKIMSFFHLRPGDFGGFTFDDSVKNRFNNFRMDYQKIVAGFSEDAKNEFLEFMRAEPDLTTIPDPAQLAVLNAIPVDQRTPAQKSQIQSAAFRTQAQQFRVFMRALYQYQKEAGLPIAAVENYFPQVADIAALQDPAAIDEIHAAVKAAGRGESRQNIVDAVGNLSDDSYAVDYDITKLSDVNGMLKSPFAQALRTRQMDPALRAIIRNIKDEKGRAKYYDKNFDTVMYRYMTEAVKRSEWNRILGDNHWLTPEGIAEGAKYDPNRQLTKYMEQAAKEGATTVQVKLMYDVLSAMLGKYNRLESEQLRKVTRSIAFYQTLRTLMLVTLSSLGEVVTPFLRTGDFMGTAKTIREKAGDAWAKGSKTYNMLRVLGYAMDEIDALSFNEFKDARNYNDTLSKCNDTFFRMIGLTKWTNFMRGISLHVSIDYIKEHASRMGTDPDSKRRIEELGLSAADVQTWLDTGQRIYGEQEVRHEDLMRNNTLFNKEQLDAIQRVTGGIARMVNEMVIQPGAAVKPLWRSDEKFMLLAQLGSFTYGFVNGPLARVWHELTRDGANTMQRVAPLIALGMMVPIVALGLEVRELVQYKFWGNEAPTDKMSGFKYLRTVIGRTGAPGLAQLGIDAHDAASYGRSPVTAPFGPTVSLINQTWEDVASSDRPGRAFYKSVLKGTPVLSALPGAREMLTPD